MPGIGHRRRAGAPAERSKGQSSRRGNRLGTTHLSEFRDLEILPRSPTPLVVVESSEETPLLGVLERVAARIGDLPLLVRSVTEGLRRMEKGFGPQRHNVRPGDALAHIKVSEQPGIYLQLDFHPDPGGPLHVRLLKEIAPEGERRRQTVVLASQQLDVPAERRPYAARYALALPDPAAIATVVQSEASVWAEEHGPVRSEPAALQSLVRSLAGLTRSDARRLARRAVSGDGAITAADADAVARSKCERSDWSGALALESNVPGLDAVGGLRALRAWLAPRRAAFLRLPEAGGLNVPRGIQGRDKPRGNRHLGFGQWGGTKGGEPRGRGSMPRRRHGPCQQQLRRHNR